MKQQRMCFFILICGLSFLPCSAMQLDAEEGRWLPKLSSAGRALAQFASRGAAAEADDDDADVERAADEQEQEEGILFDPKEACAGGVFCCAVVVGGIVYAITHGAS